MEDILACINKIIKAEHGKTVTIDSMWSDADMDSFGTTVAFLDLDDKYKCFGKEWFNGMSKTAWESLTVRELIEKIQNASA